MHFLCVALLASSLAQTSSGDLTYKQERNVALSVTRRYSDYDQRFLRFLTLRSVQPDKREQAAAAIRFFIPSASRAVELDQQIPRKVRGSELYLIDLRYLDWDAFDFIKVMQRYPYWEKDYHGLINPLIIRGDWLLYELSDTSVNKSDSYYRLLYGGRNIPKTRDEFLRFWRVDRRLQRGLEIGFIEGESGVAVNKKRRIDFFDRPAGYMWGTRDTDKVNRDTDPFEHLLGDQKHQAEEWIGGIPKRSARFGKYGAAQVYLLGDGKGKRVDIADTRIVVDHTNFKGLPAIVNPGSCVQCHDGGPNYTTKNEVLAARRDGVEIYANARDKRKIERELLTEIKVELTRNREDFTQFLAICNPTLAPEQNAAAFQAAINEYGGDVGLEQAALELYSNPEELKNAFGWAEVNGYFSVGRLVWLSKGRAIRRTSWEVEFLKAQRVLHYWRRRN